MNLMDSKLVSAGAFLLFIFLSGFWLSRGKAVWHVTCHDP